ncbi:hypothetical protein VNO80_16591 [Phaseolus coccineus]|uniref:Uncharacterized protein n=1 Tax=Phaseolus coccineus TaxID=3886 RepID=A0AAN9MSE2_PHACN
MGARLLGVGEEVESSSLCRLVLRRSPLSISSSVLSLLSLAAAALSSHRHLFLSDSKLAETATKEAKLTVKKNEEAQVS